MGLGGYELVGVDSSRAPRPLGDVDGDGLADLALHIAPAGDIVVIRGKADGAALIVPELAPLTSLPSAWVVTAGDLNDDGVVDLAYAIPHFPATVLSAPQGWDGPLRVETPIDGRFSAQLELRDFDGDGVADLLVTDTISEETGVVFGQLLYGPLDLDVAPLGDEEAPNIRSSMVRPAFVDADGDPGVEVVTYKHSSDASAIHRLLSYAPKEGVLDDDCASAGDVLVEGGRHVNEIGDVNGDGLEDLLVVWPTQGGASFVVTTVCD